MKNQLNWQHAATLKLVEFALVRTCRFFFRSPLCVDLRAQRESSLSRAVESKHKKESEIKTALAHAGMLNEKCFVLLV